MRLPTDNPKLTAILTRTKPTHLTKHRDGTYTLHLNASLTWEEIRALIYKTEEEIRDGKD